MSDTPAPNCAQSTNETSVDLIERGLHRNEAAAVGIVGLVRAAQAAAQSLCTRDSQTYLELLDALAMAEISALRLLAEETHIGSC
jgi:hypothetical protein